MKLFRKVLNSVNNSNCWILFFLLLCISTTRVQTNAESEADAEFGRCREIHHQSKTATLELRIKLLTDGLKEHPTYDWFFCYWLGIAFLDSRNSTISTIYFNRCLSSIKIARPEAVEAKNYLPDYREGALVALGEIYEAAGRLDDAKTCLYEATKDSMRKVLWTRYSEFLARHGWQREAQAARKESENLMMFPQ